MEELVSEHPDFGSGWRAGTRVATVEDEGALRQHTTYVAGV
jgi:hypothetical protein